MLGSSRFCSACATIANAGKARSRSHFGEEGMLLFVRQAPEVCQQDLLPIAETGTGSFHDLPGMAPQSRSEPRQPSCGELTLAKFQLVELLVRGANQRCEIPQCETSRLAQCLKPVSQRLRFPHSEALTRTRTAA